MLLSKLPTWRPTGSVAQRWMQSSRPWRKQRLIPWSEAYFQASNISGHPIGGTHLGHPYDVCSNAHRSACLDSGCLVTTLASAKKSCSLHTDIWVHRRPESARILSVKLNCGTGSKANGSEGNAAYTCCELCLILKGSARRFGSCLHALGPKVSRLRNKVAKICLCSLRGRHNPPTVPCRLFLSLLSRFQRQFCKHTGQMNMTFQA
eukprot:1146308-Pelagomonas_calceolata.AAC.9